MARVSGRSAPTGRVPIRRPGGDRSLARRIPDGRGPRGTVTAAPDSAWRIRPQPIRHPRGSFFRRGTGPVGARSATRAVSGEERRTLGWQASRSDRRRPLPCRCLLPHLRLAVAPPIRRPSGSPLRRLRPAGSARLDRPDLGSLCAGATAGAPGGPRTRTAQTTAPRCSSPGFRSARCRAKAPRWLRAGGAVDVLEAKDIVRPEGPCFSNRRLRYPDGGPKPIAGGREKRSAREHHVDQGKLQKRALVGCLQHREKEEGPDGQDGKTSLKP